jgi:hypothetical protein
LDEGRSRLRTMSESAGQSQISGIRQCGTCTACCDGWLRITIAGQTVEPGKKCSFSSGHDCTDYDARPVDPCRTFICGWIAKRSPLPEWMRPDKANVILLASRFHWHELPVDVAVPVASGIVSEAFTWLRDFASGARRLLLYQEQVDQDWYAFGPLAFQMEMSERIKKGEQVWS